MNADHPAVLVDGNYLPDADEVPQRRRPSEPLISRLIAAHVAGWRVGLPHGPHALRVNYAIGIPTIHLVESTRERE